MVLFTCQTCSVTEDAAISKHLSATRHKTVKYDPLDEIIECEECADSNINVLSMVRYGLSDMALLCADCLQKAASSGQPLAEYSLSNGSLFMKLPQYYKFRDIECRLCLLDKRLLVANKGSNQFIYCQNCLQNESDKIDSSLNFTSEQSDDFLYALLGIKEFVPKLSTKAKGRVRKGGKKGGRKEKVKKFDPAAEQRRAHYELKKAAESALKSGKTVKAVGSSDATPATSRSATPQPKSAKPNTKPAKSAGKPAGKPASGKPSPSPAPSGKGPKTLAPKSAKSSKPEATDNLKKPSKSNGTPPASSSGKNAEKGPGKGLVKNGLKKLSLDLPSSKPSTKAESTKPVNASSGKQSKSNKPDSSKPGKDVKKSEKQKAEKPSGKHSEKPPKTKLQAPAPVQPGLTAPAQLPLPPGISKYEPAKSPPLLYDDMQSYFSEMCYNLFLEEKIGLSIGNKSMLTSNEFELEWYQEQDRKHKQFKANILLTPELLNKYVSPQMQSLKKTPFSTNQSMLLVLDDEIPWYGSIALADSKSAKSGGGPKKGRRPPKLSGPKLLELVIELYPWNNMPLPLTLGVNRLKLLPVSIPVSRVFMAMSRLLNPKFRDLVLGKKPIRQIFFKNFLKFTKDTFNDSQKIAIQSVLNNSITVLQGPPGTGKTSTIYEIILQLLDNLHTFPILVVAASNIAIDNIAEKLLPKHGRSILRIVSNEKEPEYKRDHPLGSICLHHKVFEGLPQHLQDTLRDLRNPRTMVSQNQYKKLMTAMIDYSDKLIASASVILTTTVVAGGNQLKSVPRIPVVIMDEATQSSEPTTLIPLSMPGVEKFVFVGDQKQLSSFSQVPNLSMSLFERILSNGTYRTPHMLDTQYRMHPAISDFPRNEFYDGLLKDGITAEHRAKNGIPENPVLFWDTDGKCPETTVRSRFREDSGMTYANKHEIAFIEKVLTALIYDKEINRKDIGVITPYRGQRDMISSTLVKNDLINPTKDEVHVEVDRDDFFNESKPITIHTVSDIMVASIDAFQGREKDFLIMSCVRSNPEGKIGFLKDARRLNVALTRAKYGLILIGDVKCLSQSDALWKKYIENLTLKGSVYKGAEFAYS